MSGDDAGLCGAVVVVTAGVLVIAVRGSIREARFRGLTTGGGGFDDRGLGVGVDEGDSDSATDTGATAGVAGAKTVPIKVPSSAWESL